MKTIVVNQLLQRANDSLGPEVADGLEKMYRDARAEALKQRDTNETATVKRLQLTSTTLKFKVDPLT